MKLTCDKENLSGKLAGDLLWLQTLDKWDIAKLSGVYVSFLLACICIFYIYYEMATEA